MVFVEDATPYDSGSLATFTINKQQQFKNRGVTFGKIQFGGKKDCPLTYCCGVLYRSTYSMKGLDHIMYMIYFVDKTNHGIQIYLDMTADLGGDYEAELKRTISSVEDIPASANP